MPLASYQTQMAVANKLTPSLGGMIAGLFPIAMGAGLIFLPSLAGYWGRRVSALIFMAVTLIVWLVYTSRAFVGHRRPHPGGHSFGL